VQYGAKVGVSHESRRCFFLFFSGTDAFQDPTSTSAKPCDIRRSGHREDTCRAPTPEALTAVQAAACLCRDSHRISHHDRRDDAHLEASARLARVILSRRPAGKILISAVVILGSAAQLFAAMLFSRCWPSITPKNVLNGVMALLVWLPPDTNDQGRFLEFETQQNIALLPGHTGTAATSENVDHRFCAKLRFPIGSRCAHGLIQQQTGESNRAAHIASQCHDGRPRTLVTIRLGIESDAYIVTSSALALRAFLDELRGR